MTAPKPDRPDVRKAEYSHRDEARLSSLLAALEFAVPLWVEQLRLLSPEARVQRAAQMPDQSVPQGSSVATFNALAESLALAAFEPGGSTYLGLHWECVETPYVCTRCGGYDPHCALCSARRLALERGTQDDPAGGDERSSRGDPPAGSNDSEVPE